jgi:hypothetical protein
MTLLAAKPATKPKAVKKLDAQTALDEAIGAAERLGSATDGQTWALIGIGLALRELAQKQR